MEEDGFITLVGPSFEQSSIIFKELGTNILPSHVRIQLHRRREKHASQELYGLPIMDRIFKLELKKTLSAIK